MTELSPIQEFVYKRTYSRWRDDLSRREEWSESVERLMKFLEEEIPKSSPAKYEISTFWKNRIRESIVNREVMPSMRALWAAGEAARVANTALYNCSFVVVDDISAFSEILHILMCGTGAGFSVEKQFVNMLPEIAEATDKVIKIVVQDSKDGWAKALDRALRSLYSGHSIAVDYSLIRPRGARLKTMGGRASGPEPLMKLMGFLVKKFESRRGQKLGTLDVHDIICMIADIVVVGGVRRSSLISLSDLDDQPMAKAKVGSFGINDPQRSMANNSAVYSGRPPMAQFMKEWLNLMASGSGERGIFNRQGASRRMTMNGRRKKFIITGTNPCQPDFATLLTPQGIRQLKDVKVGDTIWSGARWTTISEKWGTGVKPVYRYGTRAGYFLGTDNHRIVSEGDKKEVGEAESIDISFCTSHKDPPKIDPQDVMDGVVFGDGGIHRASNDLPVLYIGNKDGDYHTSEISHLIKRHRPGISEDSWEIHTTIAESLDKRIYERVIPDKFYKGDLDGVCGFLRGLFTANGSIAGPRVTLKQTSFSIIQQVQEMLCFLGIRSYYTVNKSKEIQWNNGTYRSKQSYDINITGSDRHLFRYFIGFLQKYKQDKLNDILTDDKYDAKSRKKSTYEITEREYLGDHEVFDITVDDDDHTYWTGGLLVSNCGEILLRSCEFCNLSSVVIRSEDTLEVLKEKVKTATIVGCLQSCFTDFPFLREDWKKNCEEERLLGVSLNGIMDHPVLNHVNDDAKRWLSELKHYAIYTAKKWSKTLGINMSAAITCVKPEGTGSQMLNTASGIHARYSDYYIRRIRISATDPLFRMMKDQGVAFTPENGQDPQTASTWVVSFPVASPKGAKTRHHMTAIEQLEHWKMVSEFWCEHNPSCTVYVAEHEWLQVGAWVYENFERVTGLSFLPKNDDHVYQQAPYEEIAEEKYQELLKAFPKIDYSQLSKYEMEDQTEGAKTYSCIGDKCEI